MYSKERLLQIFTHNQGIIYGAFGNMYIDKNEIVTISTTGTLMKSPRKDLKKMLDECFKEEKYIINVHINGISNVKEKLLNRIAIFIKRLKQNYD